MTFGGRFGSASMWSVPVVSAWIRRSRGIAAIRPAKISSLRMIRMSHGAQVASASAASCAQWNRSAGKCRAEMLGQKRRSRARRSARRWSSALVIGRSGTCAGMDGEERGGTLVISTSSRKGALSTVPALQFCPLPRPRSHGRSVRHGCRDAKPCDRSCMPCRWRFAAGSGDGAGGGSLARLSQRGVHLRGRLCGRGPRACSPSTG